MMLLTLLLACGDKPSKTAQERSVLMSVYTGLTEDAAWTYRNQGWNSEDPDVLDDNTLVLAHHIGEGVVQLRKGMNWADAMDYGYLQFDTTDGGLSLIKWALPESSGEGDYPFSGDTINVDVPSEGDWTCTASEPEEGAATYYAEYSAVFVFNCTGGGLEGEWVFASGLGLVQYMSPSAEMGLELVAPW